jgi:hypothetical protein
MHNVSFLLFKQVNVAFKCTDIPQTIVFIKGIVSRDSVSTETCKVTLQINTTFQTGGLSM